MMEWSDLRIFLAVARAGSLGGAARLVGQTQPTMGRRLRALETALGQSLFQRTPGGLVLTDEGAAVLAHAERMEEEALGLQRELAGQGGALQGQLRVSSSDWFGVHLLTPVLAEFGTLHPGVTIELLTDARLLSLARREADLLFRIRPFDEPDIVARRLMRIDYALYQARGAARVKPGSDGKGLALVSMDAAFSEMPDAQWLRGRLPQARLAFQSNSREAQARACAAGLGLAVLPCPLGDALPGLQRVRLSGGPPPGREVFVGYHRDLRRLARLRALLALCFERRGGEDA